MALGIDDIRLLFDRHGDTAYPGEPLTIAEHSLQTAQKARDEGATDELVTAAFLHDLGHFLNFKDETEVARGTDDQHQYFAIPFLRPLFPAAVIEPIRLHVDAKRALCALDPGYHAALTPGSLRSLEIQGGIFSEEQAAAFLARPFAREAVRLRRWDDASKVAGVPTAGFEHFLAIASRCART